tara:strand:- start:2179 stop:2526 length:348 start_codon:yes stop_codon:yes gene_type:complete
LANCLLIAGTVAGYDVGVLAHAMLEGHWSKDLNLSDSSVLETLVNDNEMEAETLLELAGSADVIKIYEQNTEEAIDRSVFGSPTYFLNGDMFYGQDRLEMLERAVWQPFKPSKYR